jgi:serine/threonine-protein kinase HipA
VEVPEARLLRLGSGHHTHLSRRFDRTPTGARVHFASAMTMLERSDGDDAAAGASYLEIAEVLVRGGADVDADLEQLWRRIVFFMCVSNADDHLRNHGFLLDPLRGWRLAPAYDMNPSPAGDGLRLNVSETDNAQDLDLAREVAPLFRLRATRAGAVLDEVREAARGWRREAGAAGLSRTAQDEMARAFRLAEA